MKNEKLEKLASSEIAQSRDQLRREAVSKYQGDEPIRFQGDVQQIDAFRTGFDAGWQAAERDTRERIALLLKEDAGEIGSHVAYHIEEMYPGAVKGTPKSFLLSVRNFTSNKISAVAERIHREGVSARF